MIGWDVETHRIKPGMPAPRLVCVSTSEQPELMDREEGLDWFEARLLAREDLVAHHFQFDAGVAVAERSRLLSLVFDAVRENRLRCTLLRQKLIDNARGELKYYQDDDGNWVGQDYSLARLSRRHLGRRRVKGEDSWQLKYHLLDGVPVDRWPRDARDYAVADSVDALDIERIQEAEGEIPGEARVASAAWALHLLGCWGVRTDPEAVEDLRGHLEDEYARSVDDCRKLGLRRDNPEASRDMAAIRSRVVDWFAEIGREPAMTEGGKGEVKNPQVATTRDQLTTPDADGNREPGLAAVAESVSLGKLLTTYLPVLESGTERPICASYNAVLETFRTSCKWPNLQNFPRGGNATAAERLATLVRRCFVPREGTVFVFADYDTIEMRTLAQVCLDLFGHSSIADAIRAGRDLHVDLAAEIDRIPYSEAIALYEAGDPLMAHLRQVCKIGNYGFAGGMGARTFVDYARGFGVVVPLQLAEKIHAGFRRKWPEVIQYFRHCQYLCRDEYADAIVFPRSGMVRGRVRYTAACNGYFQELAAQGAKDALVEVVREAYLDGGSPLRGCRPWLFAHDEIGMEVPADSPARASAAAARLREVMVDVMRRWVPDVPVGATAVMCRRWYKGAKPVEEGGLLLPCAPRKDQAGRTIWTADRE